MLPTLLYVDALNYASVFFAVEKPHHRVDLAEKQISLFARAARASGVKLVVFIDATQVTDEAKAKWRSRRENEVITGQQNAPQALENLLRDFFEAEGVEVFYSTKHDNDDALAAYAHANRGAVLSQDKDFFRYRGSTFTVYSHFAVNHGRLTLERAVEKPSNLYTPAKRDLILDPLPTVVKTKPRLINVHLHGVYRRTTGGPLVKELGNLHLKLRPLRLALYRREGVDGPVHEIFPTWHTAQQVVEWVEADVYPSDDHRWDALLDRPFDALARLFPTPWVKPPAATERDWEKHVFGMHALVFELCVMGGGLRDKTLVGLLKEAYEDELSHEQDNAGGGVESLLSGLNSLTTNSRDILGGGGPSVWFTCVDCSEETEMAAGEVQFFKSKGLVMPKRCKPCRQARRRY